MSALTDTDLTVLEGLDFAPPCDPAREIGECSGSATWVVTIAHENCQFSRLLCTKHLPRYLDHIRNNTGNWTCRGCREVLGMGKGSDHFTIASIEAL